MKNGNGINDGAMAKTKSKNAEEGTKEVDLFMQALEHPLKNEIEFVRKIILESDLNILEQVKWNAPSFRHKYDFVTFHVRSLDKVHLIFHHPYIVQINSPLLQGDYKGRRMVYFKNQLEIDAARQELQRIIHQWIELVEGE
jgi:hypothetical protein